MKNILHQNIVKINSIGITQMLKWKDYQFKLNSKDNDKQFIKTLELLKIVVKIMMSWFKKIIYYGKTKV